MELYNCVRKETGEYQNPVLMMDYSDPDVIRVEDDYYMVASSFTYLPGVPLLHSRDMIHWRRLAWCVRSLPFSRYDQPAHGCGTWAPSIRYHGGVFYVFVPLPDEGIYVTTAADPAGPWSPLHCLWKGKGWIDPCPFWDEDGSAYMVHAYANSRCGIKHRIDICRMAPDASRLLEEGTLLYQNKLLHPTMEGPKMYKRNGWYYIFAPAGGVSTGWQTVLRSRDPLGPYEAKIVLHQGGTEINGPHQGAWVTTPEGTDWFYHFQDQKVYGRVLHLQPMCWVDDWPFIGQEQDGDNIGEPVSTWSLPLPEQADGFSLASSDVFPGPDLGMQWQWQANPRTEWYRVEKGLWLYIVSCVRQKSLLWYMPNILTQMPQARRFTMDATLTLHPKQEGDEAGIAVMGHSYSALTLRAAANGNILALYRGCVTLCSAEGEAEEVFISQFPYEGNTVSLRLHFEDGGIVHYGYVLSNGKEEKLPGFFPADKSTWSGAKPALFARNIHNAAGGSVFYREVSFSKEWL